LKNLFYQKNLENELQSQATMKTELEGAIKLMDESLIDKQDLIEKLREQLTQVKEINLDFVDKLQVKKKITWIFLQPWGYKLFVNLKKYEISTKKQATEIQTLTIKLDALINENNHLLNQLYFWEYSF